MAYRFGINQRPQAKRDWIRTNNIAQNAAKAAKQVRATKCALDMAVSSYVSMLIDIANEGIEEMYDYWKGTELFSKNEAFAKTLTDCLELSKKHYDNVCNMVKDKQFFADLCDAGQEYSHPTILKMFEDFKKMYKDLHCKRYVVLAYATSNFALTNAVNYRIRDLIADAQSMGVEVKGMEAYSMTREARLLADIIEMFLGETKIDQCDISKVVEGIARDLQPSGILKSAGLVACTLNPEHADEFKHNTGQIFDSLEWD